MSWWVQVIVSYGIDVNAMAFVVPAVTIIFDTHEDNPRPREALPLIAVQIVVGLCWPLTLPVMIWKFTHLDDE